MYLNCFLSSAATAGLDGNGFKLEKIGTSFDATCSKNPLEIYCG